MGSTADDEHDVPPPPAECVNRRQRSDFYLRGAWILLDMACSLVAHAERYRARAHGVDVQAYDDARAELDRQMLERVNELRIELGVREMLDQRDADGITDEHGVRW